MRTDNTRIRSHPYSRASRVRARAREYASRIIGSEHLSYKIAMDTCQGNIKLRGSTLNHPRVRLLRLRAHVLYAHARAKTHSSIAMVSFVITHAHV